MTQNNIISLSELSKEQFTQQIKNALNRAKKNNHYRLFDKLNDTSIALITEKYMTLFDVPLDSIYESLQNNTNLAYVDQMYFESAVKYYFILSTSPQTSAQEELKSLLYAHTIHLLYRLEYVAKKRGAKITAIKKNKIKEKAKEIWISNGKKRGFDEAVRLQIELQNQGIKRSAKTIYDWICMW